MEQRNHREVRPLVDTAFLSYGHVAAMVDVKAVFVVQVVLILLLMLLVLLLTQFSLLIHRQEPQPSALVILREFADIHRHACFVINQRQ